MKVSDLKQEKALKIERMETIMGEVGDTDSFTPEQNEELTVLRSAVEEIDAKINTLETIKRHKPMPQTTVVGANEPEKKQSGLELVRELVSKGQTENLVERNAEIGDNVITQGVLISRNYSHGTNGTDISPVGVSGLNILEGNVNLWKEIGCTVYGDLKGGTQKLPFMNPIVGSIVAEKAGITRTEEITNHVELTPQRFGANIEVTREGLATFNQRTWDDIMNNAAQNIDRKMVQYVYSQIAAVATEVSAADGFDKAAFDAIEGAVPVDGSYFMTRPSFYTAKGVVIGGDGSGRFLAHKVRQDVGETYEGTPIYHSGLFADAANEQRYYYGCTPNIAVGMWGSDAYEVIVDPYTKATSGVIVITISKIADIKVVNGAIAFAKSIDLDPAV